MSPKYKLIYFDFMGLAEPIRLIFAHAGIQFEDVRLPMGTDDWKNLQPKTPWGTVPILEEDGRQLCQSLTIVRYLGRKYGLTGEDEFQTAKCDEYLDAVTDVRLEVKAAFNAPDEAKKAELTKKFKEESLPKVLQRLEGILTQNGTGFLLGNKLTYADLFVAHFVPFFAKSVGLSNLPDYPAVKAHEKKVFDLPGIKEWVARRPVTPF